MSRRLSSQTSGMSLLYDVLLFAVMLSLACAMLLPALCSPVVQTVSVQQHREQVVSDALDAFLRRRSDCFEYCFCGTIVDGVAERLGLNTSSQGLYRMLRSWILANEGHHKTYASMLAEDLGCQLLVCYGQDTMRLNVLTADYDRVLRRDTTTFFSTAFAGRYRFNFSAYWHPIKGIPLGGELKVGDPVPPVDCHVSTRSLHMPLSPVVSVGNTTIVLTSHWMRRHLIDPQLSTNSSVSEVRNITSALSLYATGTAPFETQENASMAVKANLTAFALGVLVDGVHAENQTLFPGVVPVVTDALLQALLDAARDALNGSANGTQSSLLGSIDRSLSCLSGTMLPLLTDLLARFNATVAGLNVSGGQLPEILACVRDRVKDLARDALVGPLSEAVAVFVDDLFSMADALQAFLEGCTDWLLGRLAIHHASATLTIWTVHT